MIYTPMTKKAIKIMFEKHKNQVDKSGLPYVCHPFHVAEQMDDEKSTVVALLHDVVEDTNTNFEDLEKMGFSEDIMDALKLLTHNSQDDYYDYVKKVGTNPIACKVKLADLEHNMDFTRLDNVSEKDLKRLEKYKKCYDYLSQLH